jgi:cell division septation protein DedD
MSNDNAFRELRFSPIQLVIVFLSILVLGIFVFLLGISVGKKQTLVQAQARPASVEKSKSDAVPSPIRVGEPATTTSPAETKAETDAAAAVKLEKPAAEKTAPPETKKTTIPEPKPAESKPVETKPAENKPAAIEAKPKAPPAADFKSAPYYIQIGAVETRAAADAYAKRVTGLGFSTVVLDPLATDKKPVFRVRVGPYPSKAEATDAQAALATALKKKTTDFFLVKT